MRFFKIEKLPEKMVKVPAGRFLMGEERVPVYVEGFEIDAFPVTNAEYAKFVAARQWEPPEHWRADVPPPNLRNHPVTYVNWDDAVNYSQWVGKRLPTSAEWEKAARGEDGREWPWGDEFAPARCNYAESEIHGTTPVNAYESGKSPYGCWDMAGNVWEWVETPDGDKDAALRGGCWSSYKPFTRTWVVHSRGLGVRSELIGFRCCRDLK